MASANVVVSVRLRNPKSLRALRVIASALAESEDAMPWRPELKRAAKAAKYLLNNLTVK